MDPSIGARVFSLLSTDSDVAARVGSRIYPGRAPQDSAFPRIVYTIVDAMPLATFEGNTSNMTKARVQIDCYDRRYYDTDRLMESIMDAFKTWNGVGHRALHLARRDLYEDTFELFRVTSDFSLWIREI